MDILTPEKRSLNMAAIKNKDTTPELFFRKLLFSKGFRYRTNVKNIPGHPDVYLAKYNAAVFIHGCFWHRHEGCKYAYTPKSRIDFWKKKFETNIQRDKEVICQLQNNNIRYLIVWECTIKRMMKDETYKNELLSQTISFLKADVKSMEL